MRAVVIYESLTGNTRRTGELIAADMTRAGVPTVACPITAIDYAALAQADLVVVGSWTDGFLVVGQRPGRAGRLRRLPAMTGKKAVVFCTYAIDPGGVLQKLERIVGEAGAITLGGMAIHRNRIAETVPDFVDRALDAVKAPVPARSAEPRREPVGAGVGGGGSASATDARPATPAASTAPSTGSGPGGGNTAKGKPDRNASKKRKKR